MLTRWFQWWAAWLGKPMKEVVAEWHAFVQGFCESMCPWAPRHIMAEKLANEIKSEHHYYVAGRVIGVVALVSFIAAIARSFGG